MKILGIIPARKGSKGIPNKCLRPLCGKPLLQWTLDAASECASITDWVLTTDYSLDELNCVTWDQCGMTLRARPNSLRGDDALGVDVALDALWSHCGDFDAVAYLQPTCPLRTWGQIDDLIDAWIHATQYDVRGSCEPTHSGAATMVNVGGWRPERMMYRGVRGGMTAVMEEALFGQNRQQLQSCSIRSGSLYLSTVRNLVQNRTFTPHGFLALREPDPLNWVNIDDERDWILAEALMQRRLAGDYKARPGNDQTARVNENGHLENADGRLLPLEGIDAG